MLVVFRVAIDAGSGPLDEPVDRPQQPGRDRLARSSATSVDARTVSPTNTGRGMTTLS